ncbi:hypothetical protein HXX76_011451 [Chlamydomonas incerta]|uniref:Uncharacterized protein n=1 Tax=Chlamydomonas incerta TaxID=51695 RepID=A0A835SUZ7_CHLIN|nr:hypothetical protein HXX76_011451 [Chlamydomonas incerta]|eukprot:KAG2428749.1 hypothetical protein HXX76_011451 [Chlamydomonas incerta]
MVNGLCSQVLGCRESALGENDSGECSPGGSPTPSMSSSCSSGSSYISVGSVGASAHSSSCRFRGEYNLLNAAETLATRGKGATSGTSWSASQAAAAAAGGCSPHSAQRPAVQHDPQQPAPRSPPACCVASGSFSPRPALGAAQPATPTTTRLGVPVSDVARGAADLLGPEATAGSLPRLAFWQQQEQQLPSWPSTAVAVWSPRPLAEWAAGGGVGGQRCTGLRRSPGCGDLRRVGAAAAQAAVVDALVGLVVAGLFC